MNERLRKQRYLNNKRYQCRKGKTDRNGDAVLCLLDLAGLETLLEQAGITMDDVGRGKGAYCLARKNDIGHYSLENARFITQEENGYEFWNGLSDEEKEEHRQRGREDGYLGKEFGYLGGK